MLKTIIDDIIILSDEIGNVHRMEKMVKVEELEKFINDCSRIFNAKNNTSIVFPFSVMEENLTRYLKDYEELAAMVRLEFHANGIYYSFGRLDENVPSEGSNFERNGFFVYEKIGVIYLR